MSNSLQPRFPDLHCLLEFAQIHVYWGNDAIQPSHPLSPPSPPAFSLSQHQGLSVLRCSFFHLVCFYIWQSSRLRRQVAGQTQIPGVAWKERCDAFWFILRSYLRIYRLPGCCYCYCFISWFLNFWHHFLSSTCTPATDILGFPCSNTIWEDGSFHYFDHVTHNNSALI